MKVFLLLILATTTTLSSWSQTKKIALKSHSGNLAHFSMAETGNIGRRLTDEEMKKNRMLFLDSYQLDSVCRKALIYDSVAGYQFLLDSNKLKTDTNGTKSAKPDPN